MFLDEIGEMPMPLQGKLLRVLQSGEYRRLGEDRDQKVDVRIITATNRDLEKAVASGAFREDLYYRICVFPIHLPPLRDRRDDIALLAQHFVLKHRSKLGKHIDGVSAEALSRLCAYEFPGNVRELENKIHQAMVVAQGPKIEVADLSLPNSAPPERRAIDVSRPFRELKERVVDEFERAYVHTLMHTHRGNVAAAARAADIDRKNLWSLLRKYGLSADDFRSQRDRKS